jgi:hypothetical protein
MCTLVGSHELSLRCEPPSEKSVDEAVWQAWVMKGRAHDRQSRDARANVAKWVSIAGLLTAVGLWSTLSAFDVVVRFIVSAGASVVVLQALHARQYGVAALFGALVLLYNPVLPVFAFSGNWPQALVLMSAAPFVALLTWPDRRSHTISKAGGAMLKSALVFFLLSGLAPVAIAGDLSRYRNFELGTDLASVSKLTGTPPSQIKVVHRRPALIQELAWRPQPLGPSSVTESAQEVIFTFYEGQLFRIVVNYDRYETEGLTSEDVVEAISANYGLAVKPGEPSKTPKALYGDPDTVVAQWQDPQYRFDLNRSPYGPVFRLIGVQKALEARAEAATSEAKRLDDREAPQRDAARIAGEEEAVRAKLEKARLVNKPKFRP